MKVSLKVAQGVHKGKTLPVPGPHFLVGRDPECQLRPASASVSKKHCALIVKDERLYIKDFGSTNGTFVDDKRVNGHKELKSGMLLKIGPLEFEVVIEAGALSSPSAEKAKPSSPAAPKAEKTSKEPATVADDAIDLDLPAEKKKPGTDSERLAAILLGGGGDDDDDNPTVTEDDIPEGSTVFDVPALDEKGEPIKPKKEEEKPAAPVNNSSVAADLLRKMQQRPRT